MRLVTLCLTTTFLFTGCSSKTSPDTTPQPTTEVSTPIPTLDPAIHSDNLMGIYIGDEKTQIGLGLSSTDAKNILGKPTKKTNKKKHIVNWYYKDYDVTITFTETNGIKTISAIEGGKNATTLMSGGEIAVVATRDEVIAAYKEQLGEDVDTTGDSIILENVGYSQLKFNFENDIVVGITMKLL